MHGSEDGGGSTSSEIIFDAGEFITGIKGHSSASWIRRITFVTTKRMLLLQLLSHSGFNIVLTLLGTYGPFGVAEGEPFEWSSPAPGMRFHSFSGRA